MHQILVTAGVALTAAALLSACGARNYKPQTPGNGTATLNMRRGAMHLGGKSLQVYAGYRDAKCSKTPGTGRLGWMLTYATLNKSAVVDTSQRLYLIAGLHGYSVSGAPPVPQGRAGLYLVQGSCLNLVSFTPQPQHTYEVVQEGEPESCSLRVVDGSTGQAPPDLALEDPRNCPVATAN
ncbi:hypothetical protein [Lysobacter sp. CA199]|uniref:hypothetical protein n=1 Tax=Lysobacter sp. CA199 TaxID=3455608 RepID=UPI003F8D210B